MCVIIVRNSKFFKILKLKKIVVILFSDLNKESSKLKLKQKLKIT